MADGICCGLLDGVVSLRPNWKLCSLGKFILQFGGFRPNKSLSAQRDRRSEQAGSTDWPIRAAAAADWCFQMINSFHGRALQYNISMRVLEYGPVLIPPVLLRGQPGRTASDEVTAVCCVQDTSSSDWVFLFGVIGQKFHHNISAWCDWRVLRGN